LAWELNYPGLKYGLCFPVAIVALWPYKPLHHTRETNAGFCLLLLEHLQNLTGDMGRVSYFVFRGGLTGQTGDSIHGFARFFHAPAA